MELFLKLLLFILASVNSARILIINPTPSYSHQRVTRPIVKELLKRGHDVVFITTHPIRNKSLTNLREIDLGVGLDFSDIISSVKPASINLAFNSMELFVNMSDAYLRHPEMQALIRNNSEHFDLLMVEYFSPTMYAFKVRFKCPSIMFLTVGAQNSDHKNFGNFDNPAMYPDSFISEGTGETFMRRVYNVLLTVLYDLHREFILYPRVNNIIRYHFGSTYPGIEEIATDADMLFVGYNLMLSIIRPVTPATIVIGGGMHIEEAKELPQSLKTFLDNSKRGTVYISFGTIIHSSKFPPHVIKLFLETFAELPYDFLWKFEDDSLPYKLENLRIMKWFPQQDVLRHKNVKLFITQGGLQSVEEALYNQIPMLVVPFIADQHYNARQIITKEIGLKIEDLNALTRKQLKEMILELLKNPSYSENVRRLCRIAKDEPMKPIERAIWWTEYVLRHKGAKHLKGPIVPFYQRYLLDVYVLFVLFCASFAFCVFKFFKFVYAKSLIKKLKVN